MADGVADHGSGGLGLDQTERRYFLLLASGHLVFLAAYFCLGTIVEGIGLYIAPALFAVPFIVAGPRDRMAVRILVLTLGIGVIHYCAVWLAARSVHISFTGQGFTDSPWVPGAIGGLVGASGSFALCALAGLLRTDRYALLALATALLTILGSLGVGYGMFPGNGAKLGDVAPILMIYTPWQVVFAYTLAKLLR